MPVAYDWRYPKNFGLGLLRLNYASSEQDALNPAEANKMFDNNDTKLKYPSTRTDHNHEGSNSLEN